MARVPRHAGEVKDLHILDMPHSSDSDSADIGVSDSDGGTLLITCSQDLDVDNDQTIGVWRLLHEGGPQCVCQLHPLIVDTHISI